MQHFPIILTVLNNNNIKQRRPRWKINRANWEKYDKELNLNENLLYQEVDTAVINITNEIIKAATKAIPKSKETINCHKTVPWWSEEINKAIKHRKKILRIFNKHPTKANKIAFLKARSKSRILIDTSKQKSFQEFVSSLDDNTPSKILWDKIRSINGKKKATNITSLINENDVIITNKNEIVEMSSNNI